jgi:hypothetical protein
LPESCSGRGFGLSKSEPQLILNKKREPSEGFRGG